MARLSQNSAAVNLLKAKFQSGEIPMGTLQNRSGNLSLCSKNTISLHSESVFTKSKKTFVLDLLALVRCHYFNVLGVALPLRLLTILNFAEQEVNDDLNRRRTGCEYLSTPKKRHLIEEEAEDSGEDSDTPSSPGLDIVAESYSFGPLYLLSEWQEPRTMTKRSSIAIALPSGVESGDFHSRVLEGV